MAFLRIKRRIVDNPVDAIVVAAKRAKTEHDVESFIFKFAGTVEKEDVDLKPKSLSDKKFRSDPVTVRRITDKLREENRLNSAKSRWKVVSVLRKCDNEDNLDKEEKDEPAPPVILLEPTVETQEAHSPQALVDQHSTVSERNDELNDLDTGPSQIDSTLENVAKDMDHLTLSNNPVAMDSQPSPKDNEGWVYDYYYTSSKDTSDFAFDSILSAMPVESDLMFDFEEGSDDERYDEDEDSNSEGHWKNDYPDEEDSDPFGGSSESSNDSENLVQVYCRRKKYALSETDSDWGPRRSVYRYSSYSSSSDEFDPYYDPHHDSPR